MLARTLVAVAVAVAVASSSLTACATLTKEEDTQIKITETSEDQFTQAPFTEQDGLTDYAFGGTPQRAEWIVCKLKAPKASIVVMHSDRAGYEKAKFCSGWIAQAFLAQGFDVVSVNRPGYGASSGAPDFSGAQSLAAVEAAVADAVKKSKVKAPTGIWGSSSGAMAAALASRKIKGLKFAIFGSGVYDLDETLKKTADSYIKADIEQIKKTGGDKALEDRSIAYDASGLPKTVVIYHGKQDTAVPPSQAKAFSDALESSGEYKVSLQIIEGVTHDIPWAHHRKILEVLAASMVGT
jgi:alpha-beta hydrolase superfamily lysophospholipase